MATRPGEAVEEELGSGGGDGGLGVHGGGEKEEQASRQAEQEGTEARYTGGTHTETHT